MKATELMIGDWVQIKGHLDYDKVREIAMDENMEWYISFACSATLFRAYEYDPIPITAEILEKNGYIRKPLMKKWVVDGELELIEDRMGDMELEYWFSVSDQYVCPIHYVHELQHALRLCGLHELADNFKV